MRNVVRDYVRYPLEVVAAVVGYGLFAALPMDWASALGGWIGRSLGPKFAIHRRALHHIGLALPETDAERREEIASEMWDNLGRILGEYPHIRKIARDAGAGGRVEVVGADNLEPVRDPSTPAILYSGHLANWEVFGGIVNACGINYTQVYRAPNNPFVRGLVLRLRRLPADRQIPKGAQGARMAIDVLKQGGEVGMLVDQKMNDGIAVPFFGRDAMTAPALAQLGLKFDCVVVPVRLERTKGCRFRITFLPAMDLVRTDDRRRDIYETMRRVNGLLEEWIRARPGQWLWLHRRWPREASAPEETISEPASSDRRGAQDRAAS